MSTFSDSVLAELPSSLSADTTSPETVKTDVRIIIANTNETVRFNADESLIFFILPFSSFVIIENICKVHTVKQTMHMQTEHKN